MDQSFDQAKRDDNFWPNAKYFDGGYMGLKDTEGNIQICWLSKFFWPVPNILMGSVPALALTL